MAFDLPLLLPLPRRDHSLVLSKELDAQFRGGRVVGVGSISTFRLGPSPNGIGPTVRWDRNRKIERDLRPIEPG